MSLSHSIGSTVSVFYIYPGCCELVYMYCFACFLCKDTLLVSGLSTTTTTGPHQPPHTLNSPGPEKQAIYIDTHTYIYITEILKFECQQKVEKNVHSSEHTQDISM